MKVFQSGQIRQIDAYTIAHEPIASVDLMERAAMACTNWLSNFLPPDANIIYIAGVGNNGGDVYAIARLMAERGYRQGAMYFMAGQPSPDSLMNKERLGQQGIIPLSEINGEAGFPPLTKSDWVIEGLFGTGLNRQPAGIAASLINYLNISGASLIAIDIPGGLFADAPPDNQDSVIIRAMHTLTFEFPKLSFFFAESYPFTGQWHILSLGLHQEIKDKTPTPFHLFTKSEALLLIKPRPKFAHKGNFGHSLLIAGSYGMMGAAVLAARACLRSGTGLVTAHVPRLGLNIMQCSVPESLTEIDRSDIMFSTVPSLTAYNAVAVGPGIGTKENTQKGLKELLINCKLPLLLDADGLNILSLRKEWLPLLPPKTILTPHPKEFDRLVGDSQDSFERCQKQIALAQQYGLVIVLKGAYTSIALPDGNFWFNSTGNPGMATAGSGDVLTGIILALLAQGYQAAEAAMLGVFIHGLAGDLAAKRFGEHAMTASEIIDNLGNSFMNILQSKVYETE